MTSETFGPPAWSLCRIDEVVEHWAALAPQSVALVDRFGSWTYRQCADAVAGAASWLAGQGVRQGDRVMLLAENGRPAVAILLAITRLDAWPFIVDGRLSPSELGVIRAHCRPRLVVVAAGIGPAARALAAYCNASAGSFEFPGETGSAISASAIDGGVSPEPPATDRALQVGAVIYTSGSTGVPKGVMLSHRNILFVAAASGAIRHVGPGDRFYAAMPVSHAVGLSSVLMCGLLHGACVQLLQRFNPAEALRAFTHDGVTILLGTPSLYALLIGYAAEKALKTLDAPTLRVISASGAPLDASVKAAAEALFTLTLHHGYGISECGPTIAQTRLEQPRQDLSVGMLLPGIEARLLHITDGIGALDVRGPNVMLGYYRDKDATRAMIDGDGWCHTGDLARFNGDHLFITGRQRELIIRHGFNVMPPEVEEALNTHPDVVCSAVVGRLEHGEEEVVAFVQLRAGAKLSIDGLVRHAAARLASYKQPSDIRILEHMPMLSTGKIDKRRLADWHKPIWK